MYTGRGINLSSTVFTEFSLLFILSGIALLLVVPVSIYIFNKFPNKKHVNLFDACEKSGMSREAIMQASRVVSK